MTTFPPERHALAGGQLRPLESGEGAALAEALSRIDPWARLGYGAATLARYLERDDGALVRFVVEDGGGGPAGLLGLRHPWLRGPYIELFAILPGHQGKGLGREVITWIAARAAAISPNLWACVSDFNTAARGFYAANGFAEITPLDDLVAPGQAEILLRRRLK
ncbi:MAG: GNAT family N-acetyltransferase [Magnetospirillum sp.]|nr:GNAT family N-acetyltransferase [Magnetospirillum sp.]